ncbi:amidohydrolase [Methanoculleus taiwanensis]|uniref:Amidohydrolase n=1 Tax=Methanoculleus taiwanensis TaxID=1550565 RepID=A0A498GXW1_9EURY|nr:amidohydrolase family protein [Methanoculleus taiwanensis]RXE55343.1 amidohydrolase [Methanoculleus taiwanensis]
MLPSSYTVTGHALLGEELDEQCVSIIVEDGIIRAIESASRAPDFWIVPAFFNAHTHCGDTVAMDCPCSGSLADLVAPPNGLKHRILAKTPRPRLVEAMHASIQTMVRSGTRGFADFREGGADGVAALYEAAAGLPIAPVIFGREGGERDADGIGISSIRDVEDVERQVAEARRTGRRVAFHAGERDAGDVDEALAYDPDLLVHCTHATDAQLRDCADRAIPIAICPRSNWILGVAATPARPPVQRMLSLGCRVYLGTDNVMFVQPDMLQEMAFLSVVYNISAEEILRAAVAGSELTGRPYFIKEGDPAKITLINPAYGNFRFSENHLATLVRRADASAIEQNVLSMR